MSLKYFFYFFILTFVILYDTVFLVSHFFSSYLFSISLVSVLVASKALQLHWTAWKVIGWYFSDSGKITHMFSKCMEIIITCQGHLWTVQDVRHSDINVLVYSPFWGVNHTDVFAIGCDCGFMFTKVECHTKPGCEHVSPLEANVLFTSLLA